MASLFKKKAIFPDKILLSASAKKQALLSISKHKQEGTVFFVSSFVESLLELKSLLEENNISYKEITSLQNLSFTEQIYLLDASLLGTAADYMHQSKTMERTIFVLLEHYPILEKDTSITEAIQEIFKTKNISYLLSLEDDFFTWFNTEKIIVLTKRLGLKEHDILEHKTISQAIANYQKKIAKRRKRESPSNYSMKKWMEDNLL